MLASSVNLFYFRMFTERSTTRPPLPSLPSPQTSTLQPHFNLYMLEVYILGGSGGISTRKILKFYTSITPYPGQQFLIKYCFLDAVSTHIKYLTNPSNKLI